MFVYAPAHIAPRRVDRLMSQIDIPPTLLGLLDFRYYTKFLGRDVLRSAPATDRAFVANYQTLAFMKDDRIAVLQPKRKQNVYRLEEGRSYVPLPADAALTNEAIAYLPGRVAPLPQRPLPERGADRPRKPGRGRAA